jgi:N-acetylglucosaminyl-diphospho-decaprenol L-rhamnosyltransferase
MISDEDGSPPSSYRDHELDQETVDVIVISYNGAHHLSRLLPLLVSAPSVRVRTIVVDNGSSDPSAQVARRLGADVICNAHNVGYGAAANQGLATTAGKWVVICNQDIVPVGQAMKNLIKAAVRWEEKLGVGNVVVSPRLIEAGRNQQTTHDFPSLGGVVLALLFGERIAGYRNRGPFTEHVGDWTSAAMLLARPDSLKSIGGFDPRYFMYVEDVDLFWRLQQRGVRLVWTPLAEAHHVGGFRQQDPMRYASALRGWRQFFGGRNGHLGQWAIVLGGIAGGLTHAGAAFVTCKSLSSAIRQAKMYLLGSVYALRRVR